MTLPSSSPPSWNVETTGTKPDSDKIIELHVVADHAGAFGDGRDDRVVFEWLPRSKARKVKFASDSPLEGTGFEPPVPRKTPGLWPISTRTARRDGSRKREFGSDGRLLALPCGGSGGFGGGLCVPFPTPGDGQQESRLGIR